MDHVYPGANPSAPAVVLYAAIGSATFEVGQGRDADNSALLTIVPWLMICLTSSNGTRCWWAYMAAASCSTSCATTSETAVCKQTIVVHANGDCAIGYPSYPISDTVLTRPPRVASLGPLLLSGWGVELSIKKTEYIATDDAEVEGGCHLHM